MLTLPKGSLVLVLLVSLFSCNTKQNDTKAVVQQMVAAEVEEKTDKESLDSLLLNYVMGKFLPESDTSFTLIPDTLADREGMYIHKEAYAAYLKMNAAAKADGINLQIRSATRNFDYQKGIWERKWTGETILSSGKDASTAYPEPRTRALNILEYSSMPGTSRHHWGTDIDLNNFNNAWFEQGEGLALFNWLDKHAHEYGYCRPYTAKDATRPEGYNEEKWHWSYMPLSNKLTDVAERYLKDEMIEGFQGSQVALEIGVVKKYVLGINKGCRH